jgi:hypothetical protein
VSALPISGKGATGMFAKKLHEQTMYESHYMGFWIKIYPSHVDFKDGKGLKSIPINQIISVQLDRTGFLQIILETSGGQKYTIPAMKRKVVQRAIYEAQAQLTAHSSSQANTADDIAKCYDLMQKGVISPAVFDMKKKQLL